METPSGKQNMTIINESGLYALIFGSKKEFIIGWKNFKTFVNIDKGYFRNKQKEINHQLVEIKNRFWQYYQKR